MERKSLKIVFTNLNNSLFADGSRILAAKLKEMGHSVRMIFMVQDGKIHYSERVLDQFAELSQDADLVLFSYLSDGFMRAAQMTQYLAPKLSAPIIWGGIHATIDSESCMQYVDILCRGEGDEALPEFVNRYAAGEPYHDVKNFWFKKDGEILRNDMRPLLQDLDSNPWPDYSNEDHFVRDNDDLLKPMTDELMFKFHNSAPLGFPSYCLVTSRGCAYHCAYCYNAVFKKLFKGQRRLRSRSLPDAIDEIRSVLDRYPFLTSFSFGDDDFFMRPMKQLEEAMDLINDKLKDVVSRSFWGCCVTPNALNKDKVALLTSAGCRFLQMGVQTGSERLNNEVYDRPFKNAVLFEKGEWMDREFCRKVIVVMDFLVCGPYETEEDTFKTAKLILDLPEWYLCAVYKYVYYPGSPIYERSVADGLIPPGPEAYDDKTFQVACNTGFNYITHMVILISCAKNLVPHWILRLLISRPVRWLGRWIPNRCLDIIPWKKLYFKLWSRNQAAAFKGREIRHH